jgi:hypothetical protein
MSVRRWAAIGGAITAACTLAACGGQDEPSGEQVAEIRREVARELRAEQRQREAERKLKKLERQLRDLERGDRRQPAEGASSSGGGGSTASSSCGGGLSVNSVTSCPFAQNVAEAYRGSGGASVIDVYSPVTRTTYTMSCSGGAPVVCTGGSGAKVYIR